MKERLKKIKLLIMDVDGVLTDGRIVVDERGRETKNFDVQDGFGIVVFQRAGFKTAILSAARASAVVKYRARDLEIDQVHLNAYPKIDAYKKILRALKLNDEDACFIGDDLPDLEVLSKVGFAVAVPYARAEVKKVADYITKKQGGNGAVREVIELIMKTQNLWPNPSGKR